MTLAIKDGNGAAKNLRTTEISAEHTTHHIITDSAGNAIGSHSNALNIHHVDVHDKAVNSRAYMLTGTDTILSAAVSVDDISINVVSAAGLTAGNTILLASKIYTITIISNNNLTLDEPMIAAIASGSDVKSVTLNMNQNSTLASPSVFKIAPPAGEVWHIQRLIFVMNHSVAGDLSKFGGITALTNGLLIRSSVSAAYSDYLNWKSNNDIKKTLFDLEFTDKAKTTGDVYGTSGRFTLSKLGVSAKLNGDNSDFLEFRVQDDLSGLAAIEFNAQGHVA